MQPLRVIQPWQLDSEDPPDLNAFALRFLAEGDSWFSIGTLNPAKNSNLLHEMAFSAHCLAVNCAMPGDTLRRMVQMNRDPRFVQLLCGRGAYAWDGLIVSAGGNDLIDALGTPAVDPKTGAAVPPERRLLLTAAERGPASAGVVRHLSEPGWTTFGTYLRANFDALVAMRDGGPSKRCPVFLHGYAYPMPRPAGAGLGLGPWLHPALVAYGVPPEDWRALARELLGRLGTLLATIAANDERYPNLHFFDSAAVPIDDAEAGHPGESGDWINEIHLTWRGCEKLALPWARAIEEVMAA